MHLLLLCFQNLYVFFRCNVSDCNQVISSDYYCYYGDVVAQGFAVEFGGGLVHITIIRYVNTLVALL